MGEVMALPKKDQTKKQENLRLDPEKRLCPRFDAVSVAKYPVAAPGEMGVRVVDNCAEEHQM